MHRSSSTLRKLLSLSLQSALLLGSAWVVAIVTFPFVIGAQRPLDPPDVSGLYRPASLDDESSPSQRLPADWESVHLFQRDLTNTLQTVAQETDEERVSLE